MPNNRKTKGKEMRHDETILQRQIVCWLKIKGFLFTSTGAGLIKNKITQIIMSASGYRKGTSDLIVFVPNGTICIEVKKPAQYRWSAKLKRMVVADAAGTQSADQKEFEREVSSIAGHTYFVATTVNDVEDYFREHNIVPR